MNCTGRTLKVTALVVWAAALCACPLAFARAPGLKCQFLSISQQIPTKNLCVGCACMLVLSHACHVDKYLTATTVHVTVTLVTVPALPGRCAATTALRSEVVILFFCVLFFFFCFNTSDAACKQLVQMILQIWHLAVTGQHHCQGQYCRGAPPACRVSFLLSF